MAFDPDTDSDTDAETDSGTGGGTDTDEMAGLPAEAARRRRVLLLNYEFPPIGGGAGTCSRFMARELARRGHEVLVLTAAYGNLPGRWRRGRLEIRRIPALRSEAGRCRPHEMAAWIGSACAWLAAHPRARPDVMLSFHTIPSGVPGLVFSELWRVPNVTLFQGGDVPGFMPGDLARLHALTLPLNRLIVRRSAAAVANSDGLADLARRAFPFRGIGVLHGAVDTRTFCPPGNGLAERDEVTFLFAGRLTNQKGLDILIPALARAFAGSSIRWRLLIAGDGPLRSAVRRSAEQLGIADRVEILGWVDRRRMRALYQEADVFVLPSRDEGMSNAILEAMAAGLPVIGTRVPGTPDLVEDGRSGFVVPVDDVEALSRCIALLCSDGELRRAMGCRARRRAETEFSWAKRGAELEALLEEAVRQQDKR